MCRPLLNCMNSALKCIKFQMEASAVKEESSNRKTEGHFTSRSRAGCNKGRTK